VLQPSKSSSNAPKSTTSTTAAMPTKPTSSTSSARPSTAGGKAGGGKAAPAAAPLTTTLVNKVIAEAAPQPEAGAPHARLFSGCSMFKFHQNSLGQAEKRQIRVFRGRDLPGTAQIEALSEEEPAPHSTPTAQLGVARRTTMRLNEQEWRCDRADRAPKEERDACAQERLLEWVHAQHARDRCRCAEKRNDPESPN
jgi:hypothetical protein